MNKKILLKKLKIAQTTLRDIWRNKIKNTSFIYDILILISITIVCSIPRIISLSTIPPGLHGDEA